MLDWLTADGTTLGTPDTVRLEQTGIVTQGLLAGTRVASNLGWRAVDALAPGDMVLTFDAGMQPLKEVRRETLWVGGQAVPEHHWPIKVPAGALGNKAEFTLLPDQGVLIESDVADEAFDDPFAVLPARDLVGLRGIAPAAPIAQIEVVTLVFEDCQVVYAEGGALLHCAKPGDLLAQMRPGHRYPVLTMEMAALVADEMRVEETLASAA